MEEDKIRDKYLLDIANHPLTEAFLIGKLGERYWDYDDHTCGDSYNLLKEDAPSLFSKVLEEVKKVKK